MEKQADQEQKAFDAYKAKIELRKLRDIFAKYFWLTHQNIYMRSSPLYQEWRDILKKYFKEKGETIDAIGKEEQEREKKTLEKWAKIAKSTKELSNGANFLTTKDFLQLYFETLIDSNWETDNHHLDTGEILVWYPNIQTLLMAYQEGILSNSELFFGINSFLSKSYQQQIYEKYLIEQYGIIISENYNHYCATSKELLHPSDYPALKELYDGVIDLSQVPPDETYHIGTHSIESSLNPKKADGFLWFYTSDLKFITIKKDIPLVRANELSSYVFEQVFSEIEGSEESFYNISFLLPEKYSLFLDNLSVPKNSFWRIKEKEIAPETTITEIENILPLTFINEFLSDVASINTDDEDIFRIIINGYTARDGYAFSYWMMQNALQDILKERYANFMLVNTIMQSEMDFSYNDIEKNLRSELSEQDKKDIQKYFMEAGKDILKSSKNIQDFFNHAHRIQALLQSDKKLSRKEVKEVQLFLKEQKIYDKTISGKLDKETKNAIENYTKAFE